MQLGREKRSTPNLSQDTQLPDRNASKYAGHSRFEVSPLSHSLAGLSGTSSELRSLMAMTSALPLATSFLTIMRLLPPQAYGETERHEDFRRKFWVRAVQLARPIVQPAGEEHRTLPPLRPA